MHCCLRQPFSKSSHLHKIRDFLLTIGGSRLTRRVHHFRIRALALKFITMESYLISLLPPSVPKSQTIVLTFGLYFRRHSQNAKDPHSSKQNGCQYSCPRNDDHSTQSIPTQSLQTSISETKGNILYSTKSLLFYFKLYQKVFFKSS